ncbi:hypothetical protein KQI42_08975 [Tissierella sp. MSJ-40]|uniref:Putative phage metallopeptidase domain-containing protein n=1 Tax=Tissierella simiarum TaxID=2841534 RepID=A0ABS6E5V7_9FIRM|nr:putative metallopeptidase [Tissierella simiarum]MBU5438139.1 hypothetical protein [Tissierella simiarum]
MANGEIITISKKFDKDKCRLNYTSINKQFSEITGYDYILEIKNYFIEKVSKEQIITLICHELRYIDKFGDLQPYYIKNRSDMEQH